MSDILSAMRTYLEKVISAVENMKVLIVDRDTINYVSTVYSQTQILDRSVFLVEKIGTVHEKMGHLTVGSYESFPLSQAIYFIRPTLENIELLKKDIQEPIYGSYLIFFSNICPQPLLEDLASGDSLSMIKKVKEFYADYFAVTPCLYSLESLHAIALSAGRGRWKKPEEDLAAREVSGIVAGLLSLKSCPIIRYSSDSELALFMAEGVNRVIEQENLQGDLFHFHYQDHHPVLLIFDRREDPVTPLLLQWTYQAMIHELLEIMNNQVDLSHVPNIREEAKTVVLTTDADEFYRNHLNDNFGELGIAVKQLANSYAHENEKNSKVESIEDMQRFLENYGDFQKLSTSVTKHLAMVSELARLVDKCQLMKVSELQQDIACDSDYSGQMKKLRDLFAMPSIRPDDLLRTTMLFCLRYEKKVMGDMKDLKRMLESVGVSKEHVALIDSMLAYDSFSLPPLSYAGESKRNGDLFNKGLFSSVVSGLKKEIAGVSNIYTQHRPLILDYLQQLKAGKLKDSTFPIKARASIKAPVREVLVYIIGGATFEEAYYIDQFNRETPDMRVVLGGSTMLNSMRFLSEVKKFNEM